jgi:hypothetical protein
MTVRAPVRYPSESTGQVRAPVDLRPALDKLFTKGVEQIRVADLELAIRQPLDEDTLWAWHIAGVFKHNYTLIYNYDRKASPPVAVVPREASDLQLAAARIKAARPRVGKPQAVDSIGVQLCALGYQRAAELNGIDVSKYAHLDNGRRTMTVNNILRARHRKGEPVYLVPAAPGGDVPEGKS